MKKLLAIISAFVTGGLAVMASGTAQVAEAIRAVN
jgi:hypothetical protein